MSRKVVLQTECPICHHHFVPEPNQPPAWWAIDWCTGDHGLLCPFCQKAAIELKAVSATAIPLGLCPFGSDIAEKSAAVTETDWRRMRHSESWAVYVKQHHPDWLTDEERAMI